MKLRGRTRTLDLAEPQVMGVLNLTPDSFSDGGRYVGLDAVMRRAQEMLDQGAAILDLGGESSRPGAVPVSEQEEMDRVLPALERIVNELGAFVSVDTVKPPLMEAACRAGAEMINDIRALQEPGAVEAIARHRPAICLMHMQGQPRDMQAAPRYADVVTEVNDFLQVRAAACLAAGLARDSLVLDPGFGFGKSLPHNLRMLAHLERFAQGGWPLLVGVSRKSMFGALLGLPVEARANVSAAAAALAVRAGARLIRAHDVRETVQAVRLAAAVRAAAS